jgi:5-methylcytosine-specific restriction endonuclease McrA
MNDEGQLRRRRFSAAERRALFFVSGGRCEKCGRPLDRSFHADHDKPYSKGGETHLANGRAKCQKCNLGKGAKYDGI